jgi:hypothetical protein
VFWFILSGTIMEETVNPVFPVQTELTHVRSRQSSSMYMSELSDCSQGIRSRQHLICLRLIHLVRRLLLSTLPNSVEYTRSSTNDTENGVNLDMNSRRRSSSPLRPFESGRKRFLFMKIRSSSPFTTPDPRCGTN